MEKMLSFQHTHNKLLLKVPFWVAWYMKQFIAQPEDKEMSLRSLLSLLLLQPDEVSLLFTMREDNLFLPGYLWTVVTFAMAVI